MEHSEKIDALIEALNNQKIAFNIEIAELNSIIEANKSDISYLQGQRDRAQSEVTRLVTKIVGEYTYDGAKGVDAHIEKLKESFEIHNGKRYEDFIHNLKSSHAELVLLALKDDFRKEFSWMDKQRRRYFLRFISKAIRNIPALK